MLKTATGKIPLGKYNLPSGSEGVHFSPVKSVAKTYASPFKVTDPSTWGRGSVLAKQGAGKVLEGKIPANLANLSRNMFGQVQGIMSSDLANKAYGFGKNIDLSSIKSVAQPISKFLGRTVPVLGAGMGIADTGYRIGQKDYLGAALSAGSAVPLAGLVPLGVQMLTDKFGLTGANRDIGKLDTQLSENVMQPAFGASKGGIANLLYGGIV